MERATQLGDKRPAHANMAAAGVTTTVGDRVDQPSQAGQCEDELQNRVELNVRRRHPARHHASTGPAPSYSSTAHPEAVHLARDACGPPTTAIHPRSVLIELRTMHQRLLVAVPERIRAVALRLAGIAAAKA